MLPFKIGLKWKWAKVLIPKNEIYFQDFRSKQTPLSFKVLWEMPQKNVFLEYYLIYDGSKIFALLKFQIKSD